MRGHLTVENKIKNLEDRAISNLRKAALHIMESGLKAIDTRNVVKKNVFLKKNFITIGNRRFDLNKIWRIIVITVGKCAFESAVEIESILGDRISRGVALGIGPAPILKHIEVVSGTHPLPSEKNLKGANTIIKTLSGLDENDLVIFAISGGGSTLLYVPVGEIGEGKIISSLMREGATIEEMNVIRKHISLARGGNLTKYAFPAQVASLIYSDVPGDNLEFIASGPTVRDNTTIGDALQIILKYKLSKHCKNKDCGLAETPKDEMYFSRVLNVIAVSNKTALEAMRAEAKKRKLRVELRTHELRGEARKVSRDIMEELHASPRGTALLYGGETTVFVKGRGKGGRNMELALSALSSIDEGEIILACASDGRDNSDIGGAICDIMTKEKARELGLSIEAYLENNDSYNFFKRVGDYIQMGDTGSNVSDLIVAIKQ